MDPRDPYAPLLTDKELDDPRTKALIDRVPSAPPEPPPLIEQPSAPLGYKVAPDPADPRAGWLVFDRNGNLTRFMPYPSKIAATDAANAHHQMSAAERLVMARRVEADKTEHAAMMAAEAARKRALALAAGR